MRVLLAALLALSAAMSNAATVVYVSNADSARSPTRRRAFASTRRWWSHAGRRQPAAGQHGQHRAGPQRTHAVRRVVRRGHKLSVSPIGGDGVAGAATQVMPTGQNAHAVLADPSNRHLFVTNLGSDAVMQLRFGPLRLPAQ
jgi:6-phosphogluconolactonase (cycloisomerase 2 family)